jgi:hypothetical protein
LEEGDGGRRGQQKRPNQNGREAFLSHVSSRLKASPGMPTK